jgi:hypothetical protein
MIELVVLLDYQKPCLMSSRHAPTFDGHVRQQALTEAGIDVEALTSRRGISRYAITDQWRKW